MIALRESLLKTKQLQKSGKKLASGSSPYFDKEYTIPSDDLK